MTPVVNERGTIAAPQNINDARLGVSLPTIKRLEPGDGFLSANHNTVLALEHALEAAGVEFTNSDQPGVRLRVEPRSTKLSGKKDKS